MSALVLTGDGLSLPDVVAVARGGRPVALAPAAAERLRAARAAAERDLAGGRPVYGLTTGFGALRRLRLTPAAAERYTAVTLAAHDAAGAGPRLAADVVRAAMLHRANTLARGAAAVRPAVAEAYVAALNDGVDVEAPMLGSVGQSDLAPMAAIARALVARGLEPRPGEAMAMLNTNSVSVGHAALGLCDAGRLAEGLDAALALSYEGYRANPSVIHPDAAGARAIAGVGETAARLRALLAGSVLFEPGGPRALQDPLSFRCGPQALGALREAVAYARRLVEVELNAAPDNPLYLAAEDRYISTGNFDVAGMAAALDLVRSALAGALTLASERVQKLLWGAFSGLPSGLRPTADVPEDAHTMVGVGAAALAGEARALAAPVAYDVPTSSIAEGIEDHVTMAPLAARRLTEQCALGARLGALELICGAQAVDLRGGDGMGAGTAAVHGVVRRHVAAVGVGEAPARVPDALVAYVAGGAA